MTDLSLQNFWTQMTESPLLFLAVALTLGVILVNGWTDAPNTIATCVVTRRMSARAAIIMAAIFNFLGVYVMTMLSPKVAQTITKMVNFGTDSQEATIALSAAMFAIVTWATAAFVFVIPTSESHALDIISWREIYNRMEQCADACEHIGDNVDMVVMKNS